MSGAVQTILLVEDSPEDFELTTRGFQRAGVRNPIHRCADGDDALDYLYRRGAYSDLRLPQPGIILLDLNLPGTDGRDVLREVKSDPSLKSIPVIILTASNSERDIEECYRAGANSYIQKPSGIDGFFKVIEGLRDYWFEVVTMPKSE
jgi:CheY-like chemotaxis protein